jgi:hypothetical protein
VAVTGPVARLALLGSDGHDVLDESVLDVSSAPTEKLTSTIVGTHQSLTGTDHRLAATRVCWPDDGQAQTLRASLAGAGVNDVAVLAESEAATALVRGATGARDGDSALLFVDDDTATLSIVGADDVTTTVVAAEPFNGAGPIAACSALLERLREERGAAEDVYLVGTSTDMTAVADQLRGASPVPLEIPEQPNFAIARGAAMAATSVAGPLGETVAPRPASAAVAHLGPLEAQMAASSAATQMSPHMGSQLAYSMTSDSGPLSIEDPTRYADGGVPLQRAMAPLSQTPDLVEVDDSAAAVARPRALLAGSAFAASAVVGLAALAVTVAIGIRPTAIAQPVYPNFDENQGPVPGKVVPVMPTLETQPDVVVPTAPPRAVPQGDSGNSEGGGPVYSGGGGPSEPGTPNVIPDPPPADGGISPVGDGGPPPPPIPGFQIPNIPIPPITINLGGGLPILEGKAGTQRMPRWQPHKDPTGNPCTDTTCSDKKIETNTIDTDKKTTTDKKTETDQTIDTGKTDTGNGTSGKTDTGKTGELPPGPSTPAYIPPSTPVDTPPPSTPVYTPPPSTPAYTPPPPPSTPVYTPPPEPAYTPPPKHTYTPPPEPAYIPPPAPEPAPEPAPVPEPAPEPAPASKPSFHIPFLPAPSGGGSGSSGSGSGSSGTDSGSSGSDSGSSGSDSGSSGSGGSGGKKTFCLPFVPCAHSG